MLEVARANRRVLSAMLAMLHFARGFRENSAGMAMSEVEVLPALTLPLSLPWTAVLG